MPWFPRLRRIASRTKGRTAAVCALLVAAAVWVLPALLVPAICTLALALMAQNTVASLRARYIAPLRKARAELAEERKLLRILFDNIPDCIYLKDAAGRFIRVNKAHRELLGLKDDAAAEGRTDFDFFPASSAAPWHEEELEMMRTGEPVVSRIEQVGGARASRWMTTTKVPVIENGERVAIVGISRDVSAWMEAVDALEESERSFRTLFSLIPHAVWVYDAASLKILEVNLAAERAYGYSESELRGRPVTDLYLEDDAARMMAESALGRIPAGAWKHHTRDGRAIDVEISAHEFDFLQRRAILAVIEDVTARHRLELELRQAQRLEVVGQLAAGIAHEINTPIQYINDNVHFICDAFQTRQQIMEKYEALVDAARPVAALLPLVHAIEAAKLEGDTDYLVAEVPHALSQSLDGVERVATIVRAMREFAHPGQKGKTAVDLNRALSNALIVARNEIKYVADVETTYGELPPIDCVVGEINQVLLNLLVNAADAIREVTAGGDRRGLISVQTWCDQSSAHVSISDSGCGIPAEIAPRIFDPFFTTKPVGKGSGQGLAIARSIVVDRHQGSLCFEPNQPSGATFILSLPIRHGPPPSADDELIGMSHGGLA